MTTPILFDAVGWAVVHSLWQGFLIGGVVLLLLHAHRTRPASMRHATAFLGLLTMLVAFATTTTLLLVDGSEMSSRVTASTLTTDSLEMNTSTTGTTRLDRAAAGTAPVIGATERALSWIPGVITWAWLAGVGLMTVRLFGQWCWSRRLRHRGTEPADAAWAAIFESLKARCGIGERVRLLVSRAVDSPMVVGWLHPAVLVPASAFTTLDPEQLRTILAHELHHLARRDHLLNMVQAVIEVVLFFHPVTWWLSRQVRIERELRCDDATLEMTDSPRSLAEALLALESLRTLDDNRPSLQLAATGGSLMHRITRLTGSNPESPRRAGWRIVSASAILAVAGVAVAATNLESPVASQPQARQADDPIDLRTRIKERLKALGMELREQVAAGELTSEEAKEKYADIEERMWHRHRMAERKAAIEARLKAMGMELRKQVAAGEMTEEEAKAKYDAAEEQMWRRFRMAEEKAGGERRASRELEELKASIEERLKALGMELRKQVAADEMTAEEAKEKYDAAEEQMWRRFRMAEKKAGDGERGENAELKELGVAIQARLKGMGMELRKQVAAGEMTEEEAKAKYDAAEEQMWRRFRMAEEKAAEGDRRESQDRDELKIAIEARLKALGMELREQVAAGEMTAEEAKEKYDAAEEQMWRRYRMAE